MVIFNLFKEVDICEMYGSIIYETIYNKIINTNVILYQQPIKDIKEKRSEQRLSNELVFVNYNLGNF